MTTPNPVPEPADALSPVAAAAPTLKPAISSASNLSSDAAYAVFYGSIDQDAVKRFCANIAAATNPQSRYKQLHILFHSYGGIINDGIFLFNLFRGLPDDLELTLYNGGAVQSIAVVSFMGASHRKTTTGGSFLIHRSTNSAQGINANRMKNLAESLAQDDQRTEAILRARLKLSEKQWAELDHSDLFFTGVEAVKFGFADAIAEWAPPKGAQIFNI